MPRFPKPKRSTVDNDLGTLALIYAGIAILAWLVEVAGSFDKPVLVPLATASFAVHAISKRRNYSDPVIFFALIMSIYSLLPLLAETGGTRATLGFVLRDAFDLYNWANVVTLSATAACFFFMPMTEKTPTPVATQSDDSLAFVALLGGVISLTLSAIYVARNGFVLGGDVSYSEGFEVRLQSGTGVLLLAVPLGISAYAAALVMRRKSIPLITLTAMSILALAVALGQRKYFLQLVLFATAALWRPKKVAWIFASLLGIAALFVVFSFLAYARIQSLPISAIIQQDEWERFFLLFDKYLGNETVALYSTTAAATTGMIAPLPYLGDYTLAWQLAIPQFLFKSDFISLNSRFGFAYNPAEASKGAGWGFSFIGEAYLVGGYFGIALVIFLELLLFRLVYVWGDGPKHRGIWGVLSLVSLYFALWTQRNAFAFFLKEYVILVGVVAFLFLLAVKIRGGQTRGGLARTTGR